MKFINNFVPYIFFLIVFIASAWGVAYIIKEKDIFTTLTVAPFLFFSGIYILIFIKDVIHSLVLDIKLITRKGSN